MPAKNDPSGSQFEITVDGTARSYRDTMANALDAAMTIKERSPGQAVSVRDMRDSTVTIIEWTNGKAIVRP
jgi:hypothetical protein